ncbi:auxin efflux carrier [Tricladium varicosporioides]|nr:auxin efflux carrier [Hymenoscyphus varicosporioides]
MMAAITAGSQAGLIPSFLAAIQASLSVLLVIFYGAVAARFELLNSATSKTISKICVKMFLPALLLTKIGSELHAESAHRYLIILLWAFFCHFISFVIGVAAHWLLGMPDWITAAIMFNNTTSYPLLLIQSLDATGILSNLIITDETTRAAIERAKSYFLVFATVSSCLTFAIGPRLMDTEFAPELPNDKDDVDDEGAESDPEERGGYDADDDRPVSPTDRTRLLAPSSPYGPLSRTASVGSMSFFPSRNRHSHPPTPVRRASITAVVYDRRPSVIPKRKWNRISDRTRWWLLFFYDFLNAPLLGAVLGAIIGLVPFLHKSFFASTYEGGIFSAWLTASLTNIGGLFVPLPVVVAGVSLYTSVRRAKTETHSQHGGTPWLTTTFVLTIRFVVWPVLSIGFIYFLAKETDILSNDPMLWFAMMLMPTGPPAMKLITMVEVSDADEEDEHKIAKLLTVSYIISPILAFTVVGSLRASQAAIGL